MEDIWTICARCHGWLWVCENHPLLACAANGKGCELEWCEGAGIACSCNPDSRMPPGFHAISEGV